MIQALLNGPRLEPLSGGKARSLVVLVHGYGADGNDLIGLAAAWRRELPDTAFVSPHAPERCAGAPFGRQWFALRDLGAEEIRWGVKAAWPGLKAGIDGELIRLGLSHRRLALVGFSQGAMLSLYGATTNPEAMVGVAAYAGVVVWPVALHTGKHPAILLRHGSDDPLIPAAALGMAKAALVAGGYTVEAELARGVGHGIDPDGVAAGGTFLRRVLARD